MAVKSADTFVQMGGQLAEPEVAAEMAAVVVEVFVVVVPEEPLARFMILPERAPRNPDILRLTAAKSGRLTSG